MGYGQMRPCTPCRTRGEEPACHDAAIHISLMFFRFFTFHGRRDFHVAVTLEQINDQFV